MTPIKWCNGAEVRSVGVLFIRQATMSVKLLRSICRVTTILAYLVANVEAGLARGLGGGPQKIHRECASAWVEFVHAGCAKDCSASAPDLDYGNDKCCSERGPCFEGEGDCDDDSECAEGLRCGANNCQWGGLDDCCEFEELELSKCTDSKCLKSGDPDADCCALSHERACSDGYYSAQGDKCVGKDDLADMGFPKSRYKTCCSMLNSGTWDVTYSNGQTRTYVIDSNKVVTSNTYDSYRYGFGIVRRSGDSNFLGTIEFLNNSGIDWINKISDDKIEGTLVLNNSKVADLLAVRRPDPFRVWYGIIVTSMVPVLVYVICISIRILRSFPWGVFNRDSSCTTGASKMILSFIRSCRGGSDSDEVNKLAREHRRGQAMVFIRYFTPACVFILCTMTGWELLASGPENHRGSWSALDSSTTPAWVRVISACYICVGLWLRSTKLALRDLDLANVCLTCSDMVTSLVLVRRTIFWDKCLWYSHHLHLPELRFMQIILCGNFRLSIILQISLDVGKAAYLSSFGYPPQRQGMSYTVMMLLCCCTLEHLHVENARAITKANELQQTNRTIKHLLQGLCDVTIKLDSSLNIVDGAGKLATLLLRQNPHVDSVASAPLLDVVVQQDRSRFVNHLREQVDGRDLDQPVLPLPVRLLDSLGTPVPVQLWCASSRVYAGEYMVGITVESEPVLPNALRDAPGIALPMKVQVADNTENDQSSASSRSGPNEDVIDVKAYWSLVISGSDTTIVKCVDAFSSLLFGPQRPEGARLLDNMLNPVAFRVTLDQCRDAARRSQEVIIDEVSFTVSVLGPLERRSSKADGSNRSATRNPHGRKTRRRTYRICADMEVNPADDTAFLLVSTMQRLSEKTRQQLGTSTRRNRTHMASPSEWGRRLAGEGGDLRDFSRTQL